MNITKIVKSDEEKICIAIMSIFVMLTIQYFILATFSLFGTVYINLIKNITKMVVSIFILYAFPAVLKRSKIKLIWVYCIAIFIFLFQRLVFPENALYMQELLFPFFIMSLPIFIYSMSIRNWDVFKQIMKKASYIIFVLGIITGTLVFTGMGSIGGKYSMAFSYYMLISAVLYLDELFEELSLRVLFFIVVCLLLMLELGSRGAIVCTVTFVLLRLLKVNYKLTFSRILLYLVIFVIFILGFIFLDNILEFIYKCFLNFGIKSRSILLFLNEGIELAGRDAIYQVTFKEIVNKPLLGIGIEGDVRLAGAYAHNLFLELLADFGIIFGTIMIIILLFLIIKSLLSKNKEKYRMIIIWLSLGFVSLMFSGTYMDTIGFWIFLGLLIRKCFSPSTVIMDSNYKK